MDVRRLLPLSGVAFVVIGVAAILIGGVDSPSSDASTSEVLDFYDDNEVANFIAVFVLAAATPFLVFFGGVLASASAEVGGGRAVWERVVLGGAAVQATILLMMATLHFALVDGANQDDVSAEATQALNVIDGNTWVAFNAGFGIFMLGAAGCLLGRAQRLLPAWMVWAALVLGIALFIPFADFFALLLTLVWIIVASILIFRAEPALQA
jgi:hypothetical protein